MANPDHWAESNLLCHSLPSGVVTLSSLVRVCSAGLLPFLPVVPDVLCQGCCILRIKSSGAADEICGRIGCEREFRSRLICSIQGNSSRTPEMGVLEDKVPACMLTSIAI